MENCNDREMLFLKYKGRMVCITDYNHGRRIDNSTSMLQHPAITLQQRSSQFQHRNRNTVAEFAGFFLITDTTHSFDVIYMSIYSTMWNQLPIMNEI